MAIRLAIGTKDTIHILTLDLGSGACTQEREIASPELRGVARFGDTLLVGQRDRVVAYGSDFVERGTLPYPGFAAHAARGYTLYLATEGAIVACDRDLGETARAAVVAGQKDAHDLLVVGTRLYALDNLVLPVYLVLFNVSSPKHLELVRRHETGGIYPHLDAQFVDAGEHTWFVGQSSVYDGGSHQHLHRFSSDSGIELGQSDLYFWSYDRDSPAAEGPPLRFRDTIRVWHPGDPEGRSSRPIRIHGPSGILPCRVLISEPTRFSESIPFHFGLLRSEAGGLSLNSFVPLQLPGHPKTIRMARWGGKLLVLAVIEDRGAPPQIRLCVADDRTGDILFEAPVLQDSASGVSDFAAWEE